MAPLRNRTIAGPGKAALSCLEYTDLVPARLRRHTATAQTSPDRVPWQSGVSGTLFANKREPEPGLGRRPGSPLTRRP